MFSAIYIHFKTLLYTNLILISRNNIFVDLLHIKPFHQSINNEQTTWLHLNKAEHLKQFTLNVCKGCEHLLSIEHNVSLQLHF